MGTDGDGLVGTLIQWHVSRRLHMDGAGYKSTGVGCRWAEEATDRWRRLYIDGGRPQINGVGYEHLVQSASSCRLPPLSIFLLHMFTRFNLLRTLQSSSHALIFARHIFTHFSIPTPSTPAWSSTTSIVKHSNDQAVYSSKVSSSW